MPNHGLKADESVRTAVILSENQAKSIWCSIWEDKVEHFNHAPHIASVAMASYLPDYTMAACKKRVTMGLIEVQKVEDSHKKG